MTAPKPEPSERDREMAREWWASDPAAGAKSMTQMNRMYVDSLASLLATARAEGEKRGLERAAGYYASAAARIRALAAKEEE